MVTSEEYNQLAQRCARLAIACSAPSIAGALTLLALEYLAQGDRANQQSAAQPPRHHIALDTSAGFGD
jgi:acetoin utilization deacetylase AcuC-like enzyme